MPAFRVWIRSLGNTSRVRVEGLKNAEWLLGELSRGFVFKSSAPLHQEREDDHFSFHVIYGSQVSRASLERRLSAIPQLKLMSEPA